MLYGSALTHVTQQACHLLVCRALLWSRRRRLLRDCRAHSQARAILVQGRLAARQGVEIATNEVSRVLGLIAVVEEPSHDRKVANYRQRRDALFWFVSFTK